MTVLDLLFTVLYMLDTCCLQVTKVTKGALNQSQSEDARRSTCLAQPEHMCRETSISKFCLRPLTSLIYTGARRGWYILTLQVISFKIDQTSRSYSDIYQDSILTHKLPLHAKADRDRAYREYSPDLCTELPGATETAGSGYNQLPSPTATC